ncbi:hypothetical protein GCM10022288_26430 [Gryllotalpicola kribbensis]|uniref:Uncharacterized protein n=1 Tax=Gryllotalpicola kribbensis TaxID=993084 RepID=A0ABP8AXP9_9MICO
MGVIFSQSQRFTLSETADFEATFIHAAKVLNDVFVNGDDIHWQEAEVNTKDGGSITAETVEQVLAALHDDPRPVGRYSWSVLPQHDRDAASSSVRVDMARLTYPILEINVRSRRDGVPQDVVRRIGNYVAAAQPDSAAGLATSGRTATSTSSPNQFRADSSTGTGWWGRTWREHTANAVITVGGGVLVIVIAVWLGLSH